MKHGFSHPIENGHKENSESSELTALVGKVNTSPLRVTGEKTCHTHTQFSVTHCGKFG